MSQTTQQAFITFSLSYNVLKFGEFTLKSGRTSPYFFNAGLFNTGRAVSQLGRFYAQAIVDSGVEFDMLFGPAYKGISLACTTAIALADHHNRDIPWSFNRKEAKDHGEGGVLVGSPLAGKVLVIDDVITAGTAINESVKIIRANNAEFAGVTIAIDRQEKGKAEQSAIQEVQERYNTRVISVANLNDLIEYIEKSEQMSAYLEPIRAYRLKYGI